MEIVQPGGSGESIILETNGVLNGDQTLLNLIQGTGVTLTDDGTGGVTVAATGSGYPFDLPVNTVFLTYTDGSAVIHTLQETDTNGNLSFNFYERSAYTRGSFLGSNNEGEVIIGRDSNGNILKLRALNTTDSQYYDAAKFFIAGGSQPDITLGFSSPVPGSSSTYWNLSDASRQIATGGILSQIGLTSPNDGIIVISLDGAYLGPLGATVYGMTIDGNDRQQISKYGNTGGDPVITIGDAISGPHGNTGTVVDVGENFVLLQLDPGSDFGAESHFTDDTTGGTFDIDGGVSPVSDTFTDTHTGLQNILLDSSAGLEDNVKYDAAITLGNTIGSHWEATVISAVARSSFIDLGSYQWGRGDIDQQTVYGIYDLMDNLTAKYAMYGKDASNQTFNPILVDFAARTASLGDTGAGLNGVVVTVNDTDKTIDLSSGVALFSKTITPSGTTGDQTIDTQSGSVNFAALATALVVTNSLVTADSVIIPAVSTNDATMTSVTVVPDAGFFTLYANAAPTAETRVSFFINP